MKLLYCHDCNTVFNLVDKERSCDCGKVRGRYVDSLHAVYSGGIPIGFDNSTLSKAIIDRPRTGRGSRFEAFIIPFECETMRVTIRSLHHSIRM